MFRLYAGLFLGGKWYNHADIEPIRGGALSVMDNPDRSGTAKLLSLVKHSVKKVYTADKEERELKDHEYRKVKVADGWKIGMEAMRQFSGKDRPSFDENFFCHVCSKPGYERYTVVNESWDGLVEDGKVDEIFLDSHEDMRFETELPEGFSIPASQKFQGGTLKKITREHLSFEDMLDVVHTPGTMDTESALVYAIWDKQIREIHGMTSKDITRFVQRGLGEHSFCRKYLAGNADIEAMEEQTPDIGLVAEGRKVICTNCNARIGGYLDFTNFFDFMVPNRSARGGRLRAKNL